MRLGLGLFGIETSVKDMVELARMAEDAGFEQIYIAETVREPLVPLVAIATATKRIQLGPGIMNISLRSPLLTAQSIAQLDEVAEGRALLGLGVSTPGLLAPHGVLYGKPLTRMREYVQIVRGLLRGETVSSQGQMYNIPQSQLEFPLYRSDIPIYLAAVGPKMHQLAGEVADGVLTDAALDPAYVQSAVAQVQEGCQRAGRDRASVDCGCCLFCAVAHNEQQAIEAMQPVLALLLAIQPNFAPNLKRLGFTEAAAKVQEAFRAGGTMAAAPYVTKDMVKSLTVTGTPTQCRARVEDYSKAGVQTPILVPVGKNQKEGIKAAITAFVS
jgi:5,10-methylenetetrahydromethanopterin reductase